MTRGRARWAAILFALLLAGGAAIALSRHRGEAEKPKLLVLTSLPLLFGEEFALDGAPDPLIAQLDKRYRLAPIAVTDAKSLGQGGLLLLAQPRAQPPENLVALDDWVRRGGRVLLFADPALEWPSELPLGDPGRAPVMFPDTGLLAHWGLRLDSPDQRGPFAGEIESKPVSTLSAGRLVGGCTIGDGGLIARCKIGRGEAVVVADADLLNLIEQPAANGDAVVALLDSLSR